MGAGGALRAAAADFYRQSWRLAILNTALGALLVVVVYAFFSGRWYALAALLVLVLAGGPLAASLMHAVVTLAQTDELVLREAIVGLRAHWRRGLALAAFAAAAAVLGLAAIRFYWNRAWPLAILVGDVLALFAVVQLSLWPRAIHERDRPLRALAGAALGDLFRRPVASAGLALSLALVNVFGIVAGVMPFLTLTIAYSCLAAAHFALPRSPLREPPAG